MARKGSRNDDKGKGRPGGPAESLAPRKALVPSLDSLPVPARPPVAPLGEGTRGGAGRLILTPLLLLGLALAAYLVHHHNAVLYGGQGGLALCNVSQTVNCDAVNASDYARFLGIPIATYALPTYLGLLFLLWWRRTQAAWSLTLLAGSLTSLLSLFLLGISTLVLKAVCLFCIGLYGVHFALLGVALWVLERPIKDSLASVSPALKQEGRALAFLTITGLLVFTVAALAQNLQKQGYIAEAAAAATRPTAVSSSALGQGVSDSPARPITDLDALKGEEEIKKVRLMGERRTLTLPARTPISGSAKAPITVALFEDFQCPFCKRLSGNIEQLQEKYPEQVKVAFLHFPMHSACNDTGVPKDMHPYACGAARASVCAEEQGRFWPLHDALFRNNGRLKAGDIQGYAEKTGLDMEAFEACLSHPRSLEKIKADARYGSELGVKGTPTLFINGRQLSGAQPVEVLSAVVEAELARKDQVDFEVTLSQEHIGPPVAGPAVITVPGPRGPLSMFAYEASIQGGKALSQPGVAAASGISWHQAKAACEMAGMRLCTQEEWMGACSGHAITDANANGLFNDDWNEGRQYAYGENYQSGACADSRPKEDTRTLATGIHPECRTDSGLYDLHGNVKEWVGLTPDQAGVVGGSYFSGDSARCQYWKDDVPPDLAGDRSLGFRCCSGPLPEGKSGLPRFPGGKVGDPLQFFTGSLLGGGSFASSSLTGKAVILTFWASWCAPCKAELPVLAQVYSQMKSKGLEILAVNVDQDPEKGKAMAEKLGLPFPVLLDPRQEIMGRFDTKGLPTAFWIDRTGSIRSRTVGFDAKKGVSAVMEHLKPLL